MGRKHLAMCIVPLLFFIGACEEQATEPKAGNPTITILTPANTEELAGVVTIEVFGHDVENNALDRIVFFVDDVAQYTDPNPSGGSTSSAWQWNSESVADGDYQIRVVGYDHAGRSTAAARVYDVANADAASGVIRSDQSGVIRSRHGTQIRVPLGAVPLDEDGNIAAMVFSFAQDTAATAQPPAGKVRVSDYYRFTPGGFVFRYPVEVTVPLLNGADVSGREVTLYRINPTTQVLENFAGTFDEDFETISAQTYELSTWFAAASSTPGANPQGWSCIQVSRAADDWVSLCVESYLLAYPSQDQLFMPSNGLNVVYGRSQFGWEENGRWFLPQGSYTICMQRLGSDGVWERQSRSVVLNQPAGRTWDGAVSCSEVFGDFITDGTVAQPVIGTCGCIPEASVPVGTGEIQVTLQWFSVASIDLDLWVYEPSGERCYFGNATTATGGRLDRDNLCGNYENGTPENIFWSTAPVGQYSIWVDWWSDCGNGMPQMPFNVRLVNRATVQTFDRILGSGQELEIAQFQVTANGIHMAPPGGLFHAEPPPRVTKAAN